MIMEKLQYSMEEGTNDGRDIVVYALSTCGFCKRGLKFLRDNSIAFRYVYVDHLPVEEKTELKKELREKFDRRIVYPYLVINGGSEVITGFSSDTWKEYFSIQ